MGQDVLLNLKLLYMGQVVTDTNYKHDMLSLIKKN